MLVVVGWLIFRPSGKPEAKPTVTPTAAQVSVPDVTKQTEAQATANLQRAGLKVGTITHRTGAPTTRCCSSPSPVTRWPPRAPPSTW